jgi:hypothetical protein
LAAAAYGHHVASADRDLEAVVVGGSTEAEEGHIQDASSVAVLAEVVDLVRQVDMARVRWEVDDERTSHAMKLQTAATSRMQKRVDEFDHRQKMEERRMRKARHHDEDLGSRPRYRMESPVRRVAESRAVWVTGLVRCRAGDHGLEIQLEGPVSHSRQ